MMERSDAILKHETTNRRCEIYPRDIRFQSSLFTTHGFILFPIQSHVWVQGSAWQPFGLLELRYDSIYDTDRTMHTLWLVRV